LISLGEGDTPLIADRVNGREVFFKCEFLNPTGSFKDRGTAILISSLKAAGVEEAVEDSSGNAGASFAAYAARAGIRARIFVPDYASGPKRAQIEIYGAKLVRILGPRSETTAAVLREADAGAVYGSHAYLPQGLAGIATVAFELVEALGQAPGALVVPVGQGTLLLGAQLGFQALRKAGRIDTLPRLIGVQAQACAPLWMVHTAGAAGLEMIREGDTLAEGIRILRPLRGDKVLRAIEATDGTIVAVEEHEIQGGLEALAGRGMLVEPTSAVVWPALLSELDALLDPIVVILTGSGFKTSPAAWPNAAQTEPAAAVESP
jgi:threonine synthase